MSEEGPEPQELLEQARESHHHAEHAEHEDVERKRFTMRSAVTASVLAVGAALASLLSGHAVNEAILKTVEASDQWSYYQANSTKLHLMESNEELIRVLGKADAGVAALSGFQAKVAKYNQQKEQVRQQAQQLETQAHEEFDRHLKCSLSVACFQIGIVVCSVAILTRSIVLWGGSIVCGLTGLAFCVFALAGH